MSHVPPGTPVLLVARISRDTEASSSLDRQWEALRKGALQGEWSVTAEIEDKTVSGGVNLADRPKLGQWMRSPLFEQWQALAVTSMDRLTREQYHWESFAERCHRAGKEIIALDDTALDIHTPTGRMIAYVRATQAHEFRAKISEKRCAQTESYRNNDLWGGGTWPYGYRAAPFLRDSKTRYRLIPDPISGPVVRRMYELAVFKGWTQGEIARDLNDRGVLTARDHQRAMNAIDNREGTARPRNKRTLWQTSTVRSVLTSPTLKGYAVHKGEPLLRDGLPVRWAEPLLTDAEFDQLQAALASRRGTPGRKPTSSPLLGVVHCICGRRMHATVSGTKTGNREYRYYKYPSRRWDKGLEGCEFTDGWPVDELHRIAERAFLNKLGDKQVMERKFIPGVDHRPEIATLEAGIDNLAESVAKANTPHSRCVTHKDHGRLRNTP